MNVILEGFILLCGLFFVFLIIRLLVKKKINETNSLIWLIGSIIILVLSVMPETLHILSGLVGIDYPPSLLFLLSILVLLFIVFNQSIQISALSSQLKELTQYISILQMDKEYNEREKNKLCNAAGDKTQVV